MVFQRDVIGSSLNGSGAFIGEARAGSSNAVALVTQTGLQSAISGQTSTSTNNCYMIDNVADESRTYVKTFTFPAVSGSAISVNEFIIRSSAVDTSAVRTFSRFVTPSTILVSVGSIIRLTYSLKIKVPGILNQIPIVTGILPGFNMLGHLKLVGAWSSIFGDINSAGALVNTSPINGDSSCYNFLPFGGVRDGSQTASNSYLISPDINFPSVNTYLPDYTIVGNLINAFGPTVDGFVYDGFPWTGSSGQQSANFVFSAANPSTNSSIGGILFKHCNRTTTPKPKCGWYWKFLNPQIKEAGKMLSINLTQKLNRL
jgi:hypothetical protein